MSHDLITPAHDRRQMVRREMENIPWAVEAKRVNRAANIASAVAIMACIWAWMGFPGL